MSVAAAPGTPSGSRPPSRLVLAAGAILVAALALSGLVWLVAPGPAALPRSPFGVGFREAVPSAAGLGGRLLAIQASFSRALQDAVAGLRDGGDWRPVVMLGFAYGAFHAAGPGHGKAVIAGYLVAGERALRRGLGLSLAAAMLQALVAIALVGTGRLVLGATAAGMTRAGSTIETASFALVALLGLAVTWRKAGRLAALGSPVACGPACGHARLADARSLAALDTWGERAGVVLAAGARPCAGAVLILVFAASRGMMAAGVAATFAMALGTALTTGALASLAVFAKGAALRLAGGRGRAGTLVVGALELLAGAFVLVLGLAMLVGLALDVGG